jgi:hypothetical protein
VAAWPVVALVGSYELFMMIIRAAQLPGTDTAMGGAPECMPNTDPVQVQAAQTFAVELAARRVPSVRAIRARLHVGQPRAQRVRAYLAALNGAQAGVSLEHQAAISREHRGADGDGDGRDGDMTTRGLRRSTSAAAVVGPGWCGAAAAWLT